jgi:hypothetical protein
MLTEREIRAAKPAARPYRLYDREGLYLSRSPPAEAACGA